MQNPFQTEWCRNFSAKHWGKLWLVQALVLLVIGFSVAWSFKGTPSSPTDGTSGNGHAQQSDAPKIWTCSMHPQIRRNGPGDCPLCGMDLVPVTSSVGGRRTITISPTARKLMNIATTPVERRYVT
jgi:Cu(I)/Ag(I) efflux system membrane fusion protein